MSLASKIVLISACVTSVGIISYVHYKQQLDRERMHDGIIKDIERQQRRKAENLFYLQQQIDLTKELKAQQTRESDGNEH